jgi:hypothetical protein
MGTRLLVTIGTDGATNWVRTPDGQKFNLGSVPVLSFVTKLVLGGNREARRALDGFLRGEEVMLRVDDERMWELLAPRRTRWGAMDSFIPQTSRGTDMSIEHQLAVVERHVAMLHKAAASNVSAEKMAEGVGILVDMITKLGSEEEDEKPPVEGDKLAFDTYQANNKLATDILDKMEAINERIDELVVAGKRFDSLRAKADIHAVTNKVANIVSEVDLALTPWVADDLKKLASRANYLHGLFFPKAMLGEQPQPHVNAEEIGHG